MLLAYGPLSTWSTLAHTPYCAVLLTNRVPVRNPRQVEYCTARGAGPMGDALDYSTLHEVGNDTKRITVFALQGVLTFSSPRCWPASLLAHAATWPKITVNSKLSCFYVDCMGIVLTRNIVTNKMFWIQEIATGWIFICQIVYCMVGVSTYCPIKPYVPSI